MTTLLEAVEKLDQAWEDAATIGITDALFEAIDNVSKAYKNYKGPFGVDSSQKLHTL